MDSNYYELPVNMDRVCRVCLSEGTNLSPIFQGNESSSESSSGLLSQKIQMCGSIEIHEEDGIPALICDNCIYKASVAYEFRQLCQHSDTRLRMYYNKPTRSGAAESSTQTEPQTRICLIKRQQGLPDGNFLLKEDGSGLAQFVSLGETCSTGTSQIPAAAQVPAATTPLIPIASDGNSKKSAQSGEDYQQQQLYQDQEATEKLDSEEMSMGKVEMSDDYLETEEGTLDYDGDMNNDYEEETIEQEDIKPPKRTSSRKAKQLARNVFSDEETSDYLDESEESRDIAENKFKCHVCSKSYSTQKGLKKHSLVHEKKHKCGVCFKMFYKLENLEKHKSVHTEKPHACKLCHASFSKSQSLVRHLKSHGDNAVNADADEPTGTGAEAKTESNSDDDDGFRDEVNDEFENAPELFKCNECNQYCSSMKNLKRHALIHGDKKYSCTVCKKWFFRPDTLKKHAEKHGHGLLDNLADENNLFDSDDDDSTTTRTIGSTIPSTNGASVVKEESEDEGTGAFKCQQCGKVMSTKKGLRRHMSTHRPKAKPVACDVCKKVCASQARLLIHQKTHNKPKEKIPREYLCHICSKVYPSNSSLTYHMRTHSGVKPHVCKTCNSAFTTTTSLANHIRIHTGDKPFVCHVCSAAFAVSSAFKRHLTRHTGEANYLCKTCGKAFKRLSTLKEHTYTHSGEKPYVCKTCGAAYSHSGSLFAHQKRCRAQYGEIVEEHHNIAPVAHHIHVNNVQTAVRSLAVIGPMF